VLFCDVTGSTALGESTDPEALRALLARYFERTKAIVESHGGTVEKFIGDGVVAVFGVPHVHEDDAPRAARAAMLRSIDMKQMGVGLEIALLIDATIVRAVLLPSAMKLLGDWNWYLPGWTEWIPTLSAEGPPAERAPRRSSCACR
jgi:Adenylate and Guanylate cyclase catalytic domain